jgi:hypothetical protein
MALNKAFSAQRAAKATRLFQAFDADSSGDLDLEEFTMLCQVAAPEMDVAAVKASLGGFTIFINIHCYVIYTIINAYRELRHRHYIDLPIYTGALHINLYI